MSIGKQVGAFFLAKRWGLPVVAWVVIVLVVLIVLAGLAGPPPPASS